MCDICCLSFAIHEQTRDKSRRCRAPRAVAGAQGRWMMQTRSAAGARRDFSSEQTTGRTARISHIPCLISSLHAHAARRRAEGLERELQSAWEAAGAQRAWMGELQEDLAAALEEGHAQHDAAAALAEEVDALRAQLAGALHTISNCPLIACGPLLRQICTTCSRRVASIAQHRLPFARSALR